jgi:type IV secretion system protein VirD4
MASARDLRALRVPAPQPKRLTLGRSGGALIAAEERQSVIVFAPTETFKTAGFVIPALLEWEGPVLVTSVKSDLLGPTIARRESLGEVRIFDPARKTKQTSARATPLWGATSWEGAMRVAHWLMAAARVSETGGLADANFWFATAEKLLAPMLFAAASDGRPIADVGRWIEEGPEANAAEVCGLLEQTKEEGALRAWRAIFGREARQRSSIYMTADVAMRVFADPIVAQETSGADYSPGMLLDGNANTLYLCAPRHEQRRLRPLFSTIVQELLAVVEDLHAEREAPLDPPLLLLLDEAANIAPIPDLDEVASTAAGQGVQLLSVFQDVAQVSHRYGRQASTIVNNHAAKIVGSGISDPETVNYFTRIVGAGAFEQRSQTSGERGRRSQTEGETYRDLAPANVLREAEPGTGLLVYKHLPPTKIQLRPWFREATLRELRQASQRGSEARR